MESDARKGANEAWFRELNERLEQRAARDPRTDSTFQIVCECAIEDCADRIEISFWEYEQVRADPAAFVVVPGHVDPTCERVMSATGSYRVVRKFGVAGVVAEDRDPREPGRG
jgi:hypothetical protein